MIPHKCPVCDGTGGLVHGTTVECFPCSGTGIVWENPETEFHARDGTTIDVCEHGCIVGTCWQCEDGVIITTNAKEGEITFTKAHEFPGTPTFRSRVRFD